MTWLVSAQGAACPCASEGFQQTTLNAVTSWGLVVVPMQRANTSLQPLSWGLTGTTN